MECGSNYPEFPDSSHRRQPGKGIVARPGLFFRSMRGVYPLQDPRCVAELLGDGYPTLIARPAMRVVFKDAGFAADVVKTDTVQILRQTKTEEVKSL